MNTTFLASYVGANPPFECLAPRHAHQAVAMSASAHAFSTRLPDTKRQTNLTFCEYFPTSSSSMSLAIAIKTCDTRHIGFLLLAPNAQDASTGTELGECIFRSLPVQAEDFRHELAERLSDFQQRGEFEFRRTPTAEGSHIEVTIERDLHLHIHLDASGHGQLLESRAGGPPLTIGLAEATKPRV